MISVISVEFVEGVTSSTKKKKRYKKYVCREKERRVKMGGKGRLVNTLRSVRGNSNQSMGSCLTLYTHLLLLPFGIPPPIPPKFM